MSTISVPLRLLALEPLLDPVDPVDPDLPPAADPEDEEADGTCLPMRTRLSVRMMTQGLRVMRSLLLLLRGCLDCFCVASTASKQTILVISAIKEYL